MSDHLNKQDDIQTDESLDQTHVRHINVTLYLALSVFIIIFDQVTKYAVSVTLDLYERVPVIPFFNLVHVHNTGAAFSFLADAGGWQRWFLSSISIGCSIFLFFWLKKVKAHQRVLALGLALVLGGALGNFIDRIYFGYVIDFIDFYVGDWHFAAFNIADSAITLGAICLIYDLFFGDND